MANGKLEVIDYLKGYSIFTIVLMHLVMYNATSLGGAGVHIFILCSGFGLYLSHLRKPLNYGSFLKRRFIKVYVPYIIIVFISALVPFFNTSPNKWSELLSHVFLYKMFSEKIWWAVMVYFYNNSILFVLAINCQILSKEELLAVFYCHKFVIGYVYLYYWNFRKENLE